MKTLLLIGSLLFQSTLVLVVVFTVVISRSSEVAFYEFPREFYAVVGLPALTYISLQLFYFTGHWHPEWKTLSRIIALVLVTTCLAFVVYVAFASLFDPVGLLALGVLFSGILTFLHVQQR